MINTLRTGIVAFFATIWHAGRVVLASLVKSKRLREISRDAPFRWGRRVLKAARVNVELEGLEHLPLDEPCIIVGNHESWFDIFALVATFPVDYRFIGKIELTKVPLFGPAWLAAGHIPIDRGDRKAAIRSLDAAGETLHREKAAVVIFPEGTRSPDGNLLPFKKGAFVLAAQTQVPIVPIGIRGSRQVMPKGRWTVSPGTIHVRIGPPIEVAGRGEDARNELLAETRSAVEELRRPLPAET